MEFSKITDLLYIGTPPKLEDYQTLHDLGVQLVINMRVEQPSQRDPLKPPIPVLWLPTFDNPLLPIPITTLKRGTQAALGIISQGGSVYAHCAAGVHRSVALGASILIALGHSTEEALRLIKQRREIAYPYKWYIRKRIERFASAWDYHDTILGENSRPAQ